MINDGERKYKVTEGIETVSVTSCYANANNKKGTIKKLDKDTYVVLRTGEVRRYNSKSKEDEHNEEVARKLSMLREIIRANVRSEKDFFAVLTYSCKQTDCVKMQEDIEKCIRRLRSNHKMQYIAIPELQRCGKWHIHLLICDLDDGDVITSRELKKAWECGRVYIRPVRDTNAVSLYLSENHGHKRIMRRSYPANMRLYRCSRGIKRPATSIMGSNNVKEVVRGCKTLFRRRYKSADGCWHSIAVYQKNRTED